MTKINQNTKPVAAAKPVTEQSAKVKEYKVKEYMAKRAKMAYPRKMEVATRYLVKRVLGLAVKLGRIAEQGDIAAMVTNAAGSLTSAMNDLSVLPDDAPLTNKRVRAAKANIEIGAVVALRDKAKKGELGQLLTEDEQNSLTVEAVKGSTLVCRSPGGDRLFIKRGLVCAPKA